MNNYNSLLNEPIQVTRRLLGRFIMEEEYCTYVQYSYMYVCANINGSVAGTTRELDRGTDPDIYSTVPPSGSCLEKTINGRMERNDVSECLDCHTNAQYAVLYSSNERSIDSPPRIRRPHRTETERKQQLAEPFG